MSGAQGALLQEEKTSTTYESIPGGENKTRTDIHSQEDQGTIQIEKEQDKVEDPLAKVGPPFGVKKDEKKQDPGVTGTG